MIEIIGYIVFFLSVIVAFYYVYFIASIYDTWEKSKETYLQASTKFYNKFTIIIAARNEENNIERCIHSLLLLKYPSDLFEIIVIDDHSEDHTRIKVAHLSRVKILLNEGKGKKAAIHTGLRYAVNDYIVTIDADCEVHPDLLSLYNSKLSENKELHFVAGGVIIEKDKSLLGYFQSLDMLSLMATTAYGIHSVKYCLANGANMCFKKSSYFDVDGFEGNDHLASGDDIFLINKIRKYFTSNAIGFLKSRRGAVRTAPILNLKEFVQQRSRWAGKTKAYANKSLLHLQATVFGVHLFVFVLILSSFFIPVSLFCCIILILIKGIIDYLFLDKMSSFYDEKWAMKGFVIASVLYYPYIFMTAAFSLLRGSYIWKGRMLR